MIFQLISVEELSKRTNLSRHTIRNWISQKRLPYVKLGRRVLFDEREIMRLIEQNTVREKSHDKSIRDILSRNIRNRIKDA